MTTQSNVPNLNPPLSPALEAALQSYLDAIQRLQDARNLVLQLATDEPSFSWAGSEGVYYLGPNVSNEHLILTASSMSDGAIQQMQLAGQRSRRKSKPKPPKELPNSAFRTPDSMFRLT